MSEMSNKNVLSAVAVQSDPETERSKSIVEKCLVSLTRAAVRL